MNFDLFQGSTFQSDRSDETDRPIALGRTERACAAFLRAHDSMIALAKGYDDLDVQGMAKLRKRRKMAFMQVRAHAARTKSAYQAKARVLTAMLDWPGVADPDVGAFAIEVALEGAALLYHDSGCACITR
jgi:hypothetical protein